MEKGERQTILSEFIKTMSVNISIYEFLTKLKNKLIKKHKRNFTYSDVIRELKLNYEKSQK